MLKRFALKKILVITCSFIVLLILYFFPTTDKYNITTTLTYTTPNTLPIYLIDNNNYVSRIEFIQKSEDTLELVDEIIKNLTIDNNTNHIPNNFKQVIPKNTKVINKDLIDGLLKINFSKELLNVSEDTEDMILSFPAMLEAE